MSRPEPLPRLAAHTLATGAAAYVLGFAASLLIARGLGPDGRGRYALAIALLTLVFSVAGLGSEPAQFRAWARGSAPRGVLAGAAVWLAAGLGLVGVGLVWASYAVLNGGPLEAVRPQDVALVALAGPILLHTALVASLLVLGGRLRRANVASLLGVATHAAGVGILFAAGAVEVETVLALYLVLAIVPWILLVRALPQVARPQLRVPPAFLVAQLRVGLIATPQIALTYLNLRLDLLLVAHYLSLGEVGVYAVAVTLAELIWLVTNSLLKPTLQRQANATEAEAVTATLRTVRMTVLVASALAVATATVVTVAVTVLYGDAFADAREAVWALLPAAVAFAAWRPVTSLMFRVDAPWLPSVVSVGGLAANVLACIVLIPAWGLVGAGLASAVSYGLLAAAGLVWLRLRFDVPMRRALPGRAEIREGLAALRPRALRALFARPAS